MGVRYTINSCPNCGKFLEMDTVIGNLIKSFKKQHTLAICPYCGKIFKTGFILDNNMSNEDKISYLESLSYESQYMKELEFSFYNLECTVNFDSVNWWYLINKYLQDNGFLSLFTLTKNKKIIMKDENILQIEDLTEFDKEFIVQKENTLKEIISKVKNININKISYVINYTSLEEIYTLENKINPVFKSFYKIFFKGGPYQVFGLVRAIKKILYPLKFDSDAIVDIYLTLAYYYIKDKNNLKSSYNLLKNNIDISEQSILEILAIMLFNFKDVKSDVNTEKSRNIINKKYLKAVKNKL